VGGIVSSMPPGPTEFWIARRVLGSHKPRLNYFIAGVIFCDVFYAAIAFWGYYGAIQKSGLSLLLSAIGSSALIVLGIYDFWKFRKQPQIVSSKSDQTPNESIYDDFAAGFFLCGFSFMFILFWIFMAATLPSLGLKMTLYHNSAVLLGIAAGDLLWYKAFAWFINKGKHKLSPRWFHWLQQGFSLSLSLFGIIALYEILNP
jgi:threonine/homoserine/homoserine lactone efflux protein